MSRSVRFKGVRERRLRARRAGCRREAYVWRALVGFGAPRTPQARYDATRIRSRVCSTVGFWPVRRMPARPMAVHAMRWPRGRAVGAHILFYYLPEVILGTPATRGPVGARQRLPRTVHTRTDSTSSHTAAHHHSSSHFPTLHTCIPSISYPRKRIRWPCSDGHAEAMRRAFRGAIARLVGSLAACQCAMPLVFIPIHCVTRKAA